MRGRAVPCGLGEFAARHHFGHDQTGAMPMGAQPERLVGNARHRRQEDAIADFTPPTSSGAANLGKLAMHKNQACTFDMHIL